MAVKVVYTVLYSPEASLLQATYSFNFNPHIWFPVNSAKWTGGCIGSTEPLAEFQRHLPQGLIYRGLNQRPFDCWPNKLPLHHQPLTPIICNLDLLKPGHHHQPHFPDTVQLTVSLNLTISHDAIFLDAFVHLLPSRSPHQMQTMQIRIKYCFPSTLIAKAGNGLV